ncbi:SUZ domain-containing protein 1-like [Sycon ciliatum]|uniref:SUZ domain-containing protein 1-like n=1 Tax=Sycon ciliatum TaxID=27933 RepID=UPI0020AAAE0D|eukprot:scpid80587/ scgid17579/ 
MDHAEDDDGVLDNWDDAEDMEVLERRMDKRVEKQRKEEQAKSTTTAAEATAADNSMFTRDGQIRQPIQLSEERTHYTPQIRLLTRPEGQRPDAATAAAAAAEQNRAPTKTLAEREQEYALARARIMGDSANNTTNSTSPSTKKSAPHR